MCLWSNIRCQIHFLMEHSTMPQCTDASIRSQVKVFPQILYDFLSLSLTLFPVTIRVEPLLSNSCYSTFVYDYNIEYPTICIMHSKLRILTSSVWKNVEFSCALMCEYISILVFKKIFTFGGWKDRDQTTAIIIERNVI